MTSHICQWCKSGLGGSLEEIVENETLAIIGSEVEYGICDSCKIDHGLVEQEYVPCLTREHIQSLVRRN